VPDNAGPARGPIADLHHPPAGTAGAEANSDLLAAPAEAVAAGNAAAPRRGQRQSPAPAESVGAGGLAIRDDAGWPKGETDRRNPETGRGQRRRGRAVFRGEPDYTDARDAQGRFRYGLASIGLADEEDVIAEDVIADDVVIADEGTVLTDDSTCEENATPDGVERYPDEPDAAGDTEAFDGTAERAEERPGLTLVAPVDEIGSAAPANRIGPAAPPTWVERPDRRFGDRVDDWVRPQYRELPESAGAYWTPVPEAAQYAGPYGWPIPVERLPAVPDYEPATGFDLAPVCEPTAVVSWPPVDSEVAWPPATPVQPDEPGRPWRPWPPLRQEEQRAPAQPPMQWPPAEPERRQGAERGPQTRPARQRPPAQPVWATREEPPIWVGREDQQFWSGRDEQHGDEQQFWGEAEDQDERRSRKRAVTIRRGRAEAKRRGESAPALPPVADELRDQRPRPRPRPSTVYVSKHAAE